MSRAHDESPEPRGAEGADLPGPLPRDGRGGRDVSAGGRRGVALLGGPGPDPGGRGASGARVDAADPGWRAHAERAGLRVELHPDGVAPADVRDAFEAAFRAVDPGHLGRLGSQWDWRSREVPAGARAVCVRDRLGNVRAWYAAQASEARVGPARAGDATPDLGERVPVAQVLDTFAARELDRRARAEAFVLACEAFMDAFCGTGAGRLRLCFGLPVRPAWRLGRARLGYEVLSNAWWMERVVGGAVATAAPEDAVPADLVVEDVLDLDAHPDLDALLARALAPTPVHLTRTRAWLAWRFLRDPARPWRLAVAWRDGHPFGLAVFRAAGDVPAGAPVHAAGAEVEDAAEAAFLGASVDGTPDEARARGGRLGHVAELLVDPAEPGAAPALEAWLDRAAREAGVTHLQSLMGDAGEEFAAWQARGWRARRSAQALVGRSFERRRDAAWWGRNLRWILADTDLTC